MAKKSKQKDLEQEIKEVEKKDDNVTKIKMKPMAEEDNVFKVDLSKPPTNETKEDNPDDSRVAGSDESPEPTQEQEEVQSEGEAQGDTPVLEEITEETEELAEEAVEAIEEAKATGKPLPENVQKLVDFMEDTGGDLEDYVKLSRDVKDIDDQDALREFYQRTKPHLSTDEVDFLMEDQFAYDESVDDERDIKRKKLARKEQVAEAKTYLDGQKSKYYEEIKAGSKLTEEQQKAINFFNRYNKDSEATKKAVEQQTSVFNKKTEQVFNDKFKGFEYNVGDKKYRFNVNNADQVRETQSDINNFIRKFLDEDNSMKDAAGYHRSLYTAMNADAVAQHFYEQGKADAIKDTIAKDKNINTSARGSHNEATIGGLKFKVLGNDSDSLKLKMKRNKN